MANLPETVPANVKALLEARVPEPNLAVEENPLVALLQAILDKLNED